MAMYSPAADIAAERKDPKHKPMLQALQALDPHPNSYHKCGVHDSSARPQMPITAPSNPEALADRA